MHVTLHVLKILSIRDAQWATLLAVADALRRAVFLRANALITRTDNRKEIVQWRISTGKHYLSRSQSRCGIPTLLANSER
jgi:hypothetical protein